MTYDHALKTEPSPLPLKPAIIMLFHKRRRQVFVSYTSNARGRVSVLANVIRHRSKKPNGHNHLRDLPPGDVTDFAVLATHIDLPPESANRMVARVRSKLERQGYKLFGGKRNAEPLVTLKGKRMSLVEAMAAAKTRANYQTTYRRLQRGWPVEQALELEPRTVG